MREWYARKKEEKLREQKSKNYSEARKKSWAKLTPEQKQERINRLAEIRKKKGSHG